MDYPRIAQRLFNRPLALHPPKAVAILGVVAPRLGIGRVRVPDSGWMTPGLDSDGLVASPRPRREMDRVFEMADGIAYIPIEGTLVNKFGHLDPRSGMTGYDGISIKIDEAMDDSAVRGILLDIDSAGGEVDGLFELTERIFQASGRNGGKPIWAVAGDFAASAAYAIAASADQVFVPATGEVGSIGVITMHADFSAALEAEGIAVTLIFSGDHKADGNPFEPLPEAVRADVAAVIEQIYDVFTADVGRARREMSAETARATEARIFMGQAAVDAGLADAVATPSEVFAAFVEEVNTVQVFGRPSRR